MPDPVYIRCSASQKIGFGHVKRCLALAAALREQGLQGVFLLPAAEQKSIELVTNEGFVVHALPDDDSLAQEVYSYPPDCQHLITDTYSIDNIRQPERVTAYLNVLNEFGIKTVFIDGLYDEAFRAPDAPEILAYVQPYLGAENDAPPYAKHWLAGGQYTILGPQYRDLPEKVIKPQAENLLMTFGGADPQGLTATVLQDLAAGGIDMALRVIIGPYFTPEHIKHIKQAAAAYQGRCDLLTSQTDLLPHYHWADIALGGSGTSRYEFAAAGLPAVFAAIYPQHERLCEDFSSYGIGVYLGLYTALDSCEWSAAVSSLIDCPERRREMARAGQSHIDGRGAYKLATDLLELFDG